MDTKIRPLRSDLKKLWGLSSHADDKRDKLHQYLKNVERPVSGNSQGVG
ncbi:hypothetical protein ACFVRP_20555 [Bacillus velezensis]